MAIIAPCFELPQAASAERIGNFRLVYWRFGIANGIETNCLSQLQRDPEKIRP
jgi:hypothetical protein